jgi:hypothetical protein
MASPHISHFHSLLSLPGLFFSTGIVPTLFSLHIHYWIFL